MGQHPRQEEFERLCEENGKYREAIGAIEDLLLKANNAYKNNQDRLVNFHIVGALLLIKDMDSNGGG